MNQSTGPHPLEAKYNKTMAEAEISFTTSPPTKVHFNPEDIFYLTSTGSYFVDKGCYYQIHQRVSPINSGISRWLEINKAPNDDVKALLKAYREDIMLDRAVDWAGSLAGYKKGLICQNQKAHLIIDEPELYEPVQGKHPLMDSIISQAFPDDEAKAVFLGWLRDGMEAVRSSLHQPAPMMVLAGEANSGKSLLAFIVSKILGGRSGDPMTAWTGRLPWNDDILGKELLLIDDSEASTDSRSRRRLGANFKASIYAKDVKINTRGKTSIEARPVWRVMICCNEEPENLSVIPPLDDDIRDKISLLRVSKITLPMPASSVSEKEEFRIALMMEFPAFCYSLQQVVTPEHLQDSRAGVRAWHDRSLLEALNQIAPEGKLEELLEIAIQTDSISTKMFLSASEIQEALTDQGARTSSQARSLLGHHSSQCGSYLKRLHSKGSPYIAERQEGRSRSVTYKLTLPA